MTREKFIPAFLLVSALTLPIVGCGDDDDDTTAGTPTAAQPTPTATATAAPTPTATAVPAFDKWQAFTSFAIAPENQGLDYDNDGQKDNGLYAAFEIIVDTLIENVDATIDALTDFPGQEDACETATEQGCPLTPTSAAPIKAAAHTAIETAISIENINAALEAPYAAGAEPQAINVYEQGSGFVLDYWNGAAGSGNWVPDVNIGTQNSTSFDKTGASNSNFAGTFHFGTEVGGGGPQGGDPTEIGFDIQDALTQFKYNAASINGALTGGGIEIVALTDLVESLLQALADAELLPEDFDIDAAVSQVEDALVSNSDIDCSDGTPCFSVTFSYSAAATTVAN